MSDMVAYITDTKAPDFCLPDSQGACRPLADYFGSQGVLLAFVHSTWCPDCLRSLVSLSRSYWFLQRLEINLLVVANQSQKSLALYLENQSSEFAFPILADESGEVFTQYHLTGTVNIHQAKATFFIDQTGFIRKVNTDYKIESLTPFGL